MNNFNNSLAKIKFKQTIKIIILNILKAKIIKIKNKLKERNIMKFQPQIQIYKRVAMILNNLTVMKNHKIIMKQINIKKIIEISKKYIKINNNN